MNKIIQIIGETVIIGLLASSTAFTDIYTLELNASHSYLEARYNAYLPLGSGIFSTGLGGIYRNDEYKLLDTKLTVGKELWAPELRLNIGLKGVVGEVEHDRKKGDLIAAGLLISAVYSLPEAISPLPIRVSASVSYTPDSLCFSDSDRYRTVRTSLGFRVAENGEILLGYRYFYTRFNDHGKRWKVSDSLLYVGYGFSY
ncbi:MAG: hypothetical protein ACOC6B_05475 [Thermodesulfobacteriota bacterium]